ncbi:borealin-2 [Thalassophryne amazonica]|uniref:borealin-2 n=1 Tax=Thalassophryne amazonica TaxID=390379 RepID=UPI0014709113|nr:borealin-2 [Thalassophryne amazonica]
MSRRRAKTSANAPTKEQVCFEKRQSGLSLFIKQFEKEARQRMNELEAKTDDMLATVDKVFKIELMKKPSSLLNTLIGDLIKEEGISSSEVSILATKQEFPEMKRSLTRTLSKKVKENDAASTQPALRSSTRTTKGVAGSKRARTLVASSSAGNLGGTSVTVKRTQSRLAKPTEENKAKLRSVVSAGDLHCSMAGSCAHITVTTAQGQTLSFSDETKDKINLELLDDVAWCQIQRLTRLMEHLSRRNQCQQ